MRGRSQPILAVVAGLGAAVGLVSLARRWLDVVEVHGSSMAPALHPGDRLLVERWTYARREPRPGEMVLAPDPRSPSRELVKRVGDVRGPRLTLHGDAGTASTDSRVFGSVPVASVRWRVTLRYWPVARRGPAPPAHPQPRSRPAGSGAPTR